MAHFLTPPIDWDKVPIDWLRQIFVESFSDKFEKMFLYVCDLAMHFYKNTFMPYKVFTQTNQGKTFLYFNTLSDACFKTFFLQDTCLSALDMRL